MFICLHIWFFLKSLSDRKYFHSRKAWLEMRWAYNWTYFVLPWPDASRRYANIWFGCYSITLFWLFFKYFGLLSQSLDNEKLINSDLFNSKALKTSAIITSRFEHRSCNQSFVWRHIIDGHLELLITFSIWCYRRYEVLTRESFARDDKLRAKFFPMGMMEESAFMSYEIFNSTSFHPDNILSNSIVSHNMYRLSFLKRRYQLLLLVAMMTFMVSLGLVSRSIWNFLSSPVILRWNFILTTFEQMDGIF